MVPGRWPLRRKLVASVAISLIPVLLAAYWLVTESVTQAEASVRRGSLLTAEATEAQIDRSVATAKRLLALLAEQAPVVNGDEDVARHLFERILLSYQEFINVFAVDNNGRIFATARWDAGEPTELVDSRYLRQVMVTWSSISRTRVTSHSTGVPTIVVTVPIENKEGRQIGTLIGELSLVNLRSKMALTRFGEASHSDITLVDSEGTVLANQNWRYVTNGVNLANWPAVQAALRGERGTLDLDDPLTGQRVLVAFVPVGETSWALTVSQPKAAVYAAVWSVVVRSSLILLLGLFGTAALVWVLLRWTSRPLEALRARVHSLVESNQASRPGEGVSDELQELTSAFDSLARMLVTRDAQSAELNREIERSNVQLRHLLANIARSEDEQRRDIAIAVHDGVAQLLATALFEAQDAEHCLVSDSAAAQQKISSTLRLLRQASQELRCALFELHSRSVEKGTLATVLREYVARFAIVTGLRCKLDVSGVPVELDAAVETVVYRIFQEALHNVRKHAQATAVHCAVWFLSSSVKVVIRDDGGGFNARLSTAPGHLGLISMEERVQGIGGQLAIDSEPGRGTTITLEIPIVATMEQATGLGFAAAV